MEKWKRLKKDVSQEVIELKKNKENLTDMAISNLKKLLNDPDKKIRLRAISLILRHSNKVSLPNNNDPFSEELDAIFESINKDLKLKLNTEDES